MPDDLPTRPPRDTERLAVVRALTEARTHGEITRDDQVERTDMALRAVSLAELAALVEDLDNPPTLPKPAASRRGLLLGAVGLVAAGAVGFAALSGADEPDAAARPSPASSTATASPAPAPTHAPTPVPTPEPPAPDIDLYTVAGLKVLIAEYHEKLGTWQAYDLSVLDHDQASADAAILPIRKRRLQWWSWSPDERWSTNFDPMQVTSSNEQVVDLRKVDLAAVVANIPRARRTSNVEEPDALGIFFTHDPEHGAVVRFHVGNQYSEVGTMTTDLSGKVLERRPFERS
ncbi:DUF1707 domain-containing protein [Nocardioides sp. QY071]|uniref:DUF1707 SHOCT-like domain-containing protein n=1 Tax=Nocardioides sp. QY071 TaxID=3044187 RepID=UPI002499D735|nr:DUF1707 domain-containing protein [Nocardioides sp. QY071]WGY04073.1 DUF1707 domain-containing protein [Nocardioides sp. QY071]